MRLFLMAVTIVLCIGAVSVLAVEGTPKETAGTKPVVEKPEVSVKVNMEDIKSVLVVFLILSVVFEVALTPLFNWRVFMARFEGKGYKTPITVVLAFVVFWGYDLDIISDLLVAMNRSAKMSIGGQILTALLIAGGSSGVFQILTKLKIRMEPKDRAAKAEEAKRELAEEKRKAEEAKKRTVQE